MNNKKTTLLAAAAAVGLTTTLLGATASFAADNASTNTTTDSTREAMHQEMDAFRDSVDTTMKDGDFNAWKEKMLAQNQKMKDQADAQVTQENFDTLKKAYDLKQAGKDDEARQVMKDSGIRGPGMMGMQGHGGEHRGEKGERPADAPADAQK